jgi:probable rRNA maturation factor
VSGSLVLGNRQCTRAIDLRCMRKILTELLEEWPGQPDYDLGIHLVSASEMARLNESFLRHQGPTDVITFDYAERSEPRLHGEILICMDVAVDQARRYRTSWTSELLRYAIHGLLHLQGFDDRRAAARRRMKGVENRLVRRWKRRAELELPAGKRLEPKRQST